MSNKTYDRLKFVALLAAPIITLICKILEIWNVPYASQLTATFAAVNACIGAIVVIAQKAYDERG